MKRVFLSALSAALFATMVWTPAANAASEAEKLAAIQAGLAHLATLQAVDGSWNVSGYKDAGTGAAVFAFLSQKGKWPTDAPTQAAYTTAVANGIAFLLTDAQTETVSVNSANQNVCPGGSGTCLGIYWYQSLQSYSTGLVASAVDVYGLAQGLTNIGITTGKLAGLNWQQIAQGISNAFMAYQATSGSDAGGWHYSPSYSDADMSTHQWGVISIGYSEANGSVTPAFVRTVMKNNWLQNDQASNGSACYNLPSSGLCTFSDTGGWLTSEAFVGNAATAGPNKAMSWMDANW